MMHHLILDGVVPRTKHSLEFLSMLTFKEEDTSCEYEYHVNPIKSCSRIPHYTGRF
jgi:hypothetical protein